jgi:transposase
MRSVSRVVLATGTAPEYFPKEFLRISKVIIARRGFGSTLFERKHVEYFTKLWFGREYQFRALVHEFTDEVPWRSELGLPRWLEQRIEGRKKATARAIIEWATKKGED